MTDWHISNCDKVLHFDFPKNFEIFCGRVGREYSTRQRPRILSIAFMLDGEEEVQMQEIAKNCYVPFRDCPSDCQKYM